MGVWEEAGGREGGSGAKRREGRREVARGSQRRSLPAEPSASVT